MRAATILALTAGAATVAVGTGVVVRARRARRLAAAPGPSPGEASSDPAAYAVGPIDPAAMSLALPMDMLLNVSTLVAPKAVGYRLVDAVAMASRVLSWAEAGQGNFTDEQRATLASFRVQLESWAGAGGPGLTDRERVRGIIYSVILPIVSSELGVRWLMPWYYAHRDDPLYQAQLGGVAAWIGMYVLAPQTGWVLVPARRQFYDGWAHPLPAPGWDWHGYADAYGWQVGSVQDRKLALIQIYWRMLSYIVDTCTASPGYESELGNICDVRDAAVRYINGISEVEATKGNSMEVIAAGNLKRVELLTGAPAANFLLGAAVEAHFGWKQLVTVIVALVGSVVGTPAVGAALGAGLAIALSVSATVISTAVSIADAIAKGGNVAAAMQGALGAGVTDWLQTQAKLLLPPDITKAAQLVGKYGKVVL